ncbi:MAG: phenylacetate--CoA ligase family protein [Rhodospirillaceae bacterium]|jgi:phenylacetate-CoA ligase|nr:phenylacetate--CoA ligase family protein [Rhodospirillaceae bacterium]MBT5938858.1 phenylacetate--CoA ligase family protein [Rhodospirillaceae bacterium]MBT7265273.1 phenylacetate--CoA ligase family protein [Rhodospirillaceae bacterium]
MQRSAIQKENQYFHKKLEMLSPGELKILQFKSTKETLENAYHNSGFYRDLFDAAKVTPDHYRKNEDIQRFPFTGKQALMEDQQEHPPYGRRLCIPPEEIRRINMTSGSSGLGQEIHCHDQVAIDAANGSTACHFRALGLSKGDVSAVLHPIGTMTGGMLSYEGLRLAEAVPLPLAVFNTNQKIELMSQFDLRNIITTPAYLSRITGLLEEKGQDPKELFPNLIGITLSTEPFTVDWAERMEAIWNTVIHDIYGSSQLNLNYGYTCKYGAVPDGSFGHYHLADYFALVEVLDKDTGKNTEPGEWGEPVITTFSRPAMPLIRFRSSDRVHRMATGPCDCGRTSNMLWEVGTISRYDDMIKIKATNVWPRTIDEAVFANDEIEEYNGRVFLEENGRETAEVQIEFKKSTLDEQAHKRILENLTRKIKDTTQVSMTVTEVPHGTLPRFEYKVKRWTDERIEGLQHVRFVEK